MSTKELADFAAGIHFEALPHEVVAKAKGSIRDFLGVALYVINAPLPFQAIKPVDDTF